MEVSVMILREHYLKKIISYKDTEFIKVITGVRRSGKSFLLKMFEDYLLSVKVDKNQIFYLNFEHPDSYGLTSHDALFSFIQKKIVTTKKVYFLFDEIQEVENWQKLINGLRVAYDSDIYITGSNASLLSGELATYLSGRYVEISMMPLSFGEFLIFKNYTNEGLKNSYFTEYLSFGGFPSVALLDNSDLIQDVLKGIFNSIILKDVSLRGDIKDPELLMKVVHFLMDNIGQSVSSNKIANYIISGGRKVKSDTIEKYLSLLENSFIFYKAVRYDIRGKERLKTLGKYYCVDTGLRNSVLNRLNMDLGSQIENIVYLKLVQSGYRVFVGKYDQIEVDFVCFKDKEQKYVQVAWQLPKNDRREFESLLKIPDNYERLIVTMDQSAVGNFEGIKVEYLVDFLM